jgi:hypothetical protein
LLAGVLVAGALLTGCGKPAGPESTPATDNAPKAADVTVTPVETPQATAAEAPAVTVAPVEVPKAAAPQEAAPVPVAPVAAPVAPVAPEAAPKPAVEVTPVAPPGKSAENKAAASLIAQAEKIRDAWKAGTPSKEESAKFTAERNALLKEVKPIKVSDALDLVAYRWKNLGGGQYQLQWLFKVNAPIKKDLLAYVYAQVDKSHASEVEKDLGYQRDGLLNWTLDLRECPPSSKWAPNQYVFAVSRPIEAKPVPYNMQFNLFSKDKKGKTQKFGDIVKLGWVADLDQ